MSNSDISLPLVERLRPFNLLWPNLGPGIGRGSFSLTSVPLFLALELHINMIRWGYLAAFSWLGFSGQSRGFGVEHYNNVV